MKDVCNKWYVVIAMVLVGVGSFFLGGLFVHSLHDSSGAASVQLRPLPTEQPYNERQVYASKRGKRYYPWWCNAGNTIVEENKIWYDTPELAQKEGYSIAKGCQ